MTGATLDKTEFLDWAYGELLDNRNRGVLAEFIVAKALGLTDTHRSEWDDVDLTYKGCGIEVKSSANLQAWHQSTPSRCTFGIPKKVAYWDPELRQRKPLCPPKRVADVYVFCHFAATDKDTAEPLRTDQWDFYVLATSTVDRHFGDQKQVALTRIQTCCHAVEFNALHATIESVHTGTVPRAFFAET